LQTFTPNGVNQKSKVSYLFAQASTLLKVPLTAVRLVYAGLEIKYEEKKDEVLEDLGVYDSTAEKETIMHAIVKVGGTPTGASNALVLGSRKIIGTGMKNQGATCYMNSLLQVLRHLPRFWDLVMGIPTAIPTPGATISVPLALQRLFCTLRQVRSPPVPASTEELTDSFGWTKAQARQQQDIQELMRVLFDYLDENLKATPRAGELERITGLTIKSYVRCKNVDYESSREESHLDLGLEVKGQKDLISALRQYCEPETLDGDNKYDAGEHGLQDATKGVTIVRTAPILNIYLKRFAYDPFKDTTVKVNDRFEFPFEVNLNEFIPSEMAVAEAEGEGVEEKKICEKGGESGACKVETKVMKVEETAAAPSETLSCKAVDQIYLLHSVVVHSGGSNAGHYYAFIRPDVLSSDWVVCNDGIYAKATEAEVRATYGGNMTSYNGTYSLNSANAYMLTYVRKSDARVMPELPGSVPKHVMHHCESRNIEVEKEREEAEKNKLWMKLKVVTMPPASSVAALEASFKTAAVQLDILRTLPPADLMKWFAKSSEKVGGEDVREPLDGIKLVTGNAEPFKKARLAWAWDGSKLAAITESAELGTLSLRSGHGVVSIILTDDDIVGSSTDDAEQPILLSLRQITRLSMTDDEVEVTGGGGTPKGLHDRTIGTLPVSRNAKVSCVLEKVSEILGLSSVDIGLSVARVQTDALDAHKIAWGKGSICLKSGVGISSLVTAGVIKNGSLIYVESVEAAAEELEEQSKEEDHMSDTCGSTDSSSTLQNFKCTEEQARKSVSESKPVELLVEYDRPVAVTMAMDVEVSTSIAEKAIPSPGSQKESALPKGDVAELFQWRAAHARMTLQPKNAVKDAPVSVATVLWLRKSLTYPEIVAAIAEKLGEEAACIQLYKQTGNAWSTYFAIRPGDVVDLENMLHKVVMPVVLKYEVLDMSIKEASKFTDLSVKCWTSVDKNEEDDLYDEPSTISTATVTNMVQKQQIRVPKIGGKVSDLKNAVAAKMSCDVDVLRLYHGNDSEIGGILQDETQSIIAVQNIKLGKAQVYAQCVSTHEGEEVPVCHYEMRGKVVKRFGEPFLLQIEPDDSAGVLLQRVVTWLGIESSSDWCLAILKSGFAPQVPVELQSDANVLGAIQAAATEKTPGSAIHLGLKHRAPVAATRQVGITIKREGSHWQPKA